MHEEIIKKTEPELEKAVDFVQKKLASVRTGRASPILVEDIKADCFGEMLPIKQLGAISVPSPRQIMIQPWDRSYIESIEKALAREASGLSPIVEGPNIIINLPSMSEELRKEMVKIIFQAEDNAKKTIRKFRDEAWSEIQEKTREGLIREDDKFRAKDKLQELVDKYNKKIDELVERKKKELEG
ncbi:MAG: ribosome-recycling factor [Candidatus Paceibacterota bacterium]|jgi:ribosome recycling factor|nr:ribosome-recycling factor [Candidatus Paceibacterota bacterium]MDD5555079.1 ribosome-recycling factor [Candidatus Paceibacterota bacterium]